MTARQRRQCARCDGPAQFDANCRPQTVASTDPFGYAIRESICHACQRQRVRKRSNAAAAERRAQARVNLLYRLGFSGVECFECPWPVELNAAGKTPPCGKDGVHRCRSCQRRRNREAAARRRKLSAAERLDVVARAGGKCEICKKSLAGVPINVDHRDPLDAGGADELSNWQAVCVPCHRRKTGREATSRAARRRAERHAEAYRSVAHIRQKRRP